MALSKEDAGESIGSKETLSWEKGQAEKADKIAMWMTT